MRAGCGRGGGDGWATGGNSGAEGGNNGPSVVEKAVPIVKGEENSS